MNIGAVIGGAGSVSTDHKSTQAGSEQETGRPLGKGWKPYNGPNIVKNADGIYEFEKTPLQKRVAYPFRAIKNRMINSAMLGGIIAGVLAISIPALVGSVVGGVAGGVVKLAKMVAGHDSNAHKVGAAIGRITGILVSMPAAITLGVVAAAAFAVIGLAGGVIHLPVDVYHAVTMDESKLRPDPIDFQKNIEILKQRMKIRSYSGQP
ncbi:hypothetical protein [Endozoicomonas sp.]|uniref:hypothetical protein n=1 Tax=Endozoicomonas sp. TaxID=1892382 RepID=UPI00288603DA|nr:hypothetical protein [Endozoicomonas sp.]